MISVLNGDLAIDAFAEDQGIVCRKKESVSAARVFAMDGNLPRFRIVNVSTLVGDVIEIYPTVRSKRRAFGKFVAVTELLSRSSEIPQRQLRLLVPQFQEMAWDFPEVECCATGPAWHRCERRPRELAGR